MADRDRGDEHPSLELPKLTWRRPRRTPDAGRPRGPVAPPPQSEPRPEPEAAAPPTVVVDDGPREEPEAKQPGRRAWRRGGMPMAVLTGVVVGLGIVGLTWASLKMCEGVRGTSSCGDKGYGLLLAILVAMVVVGALLLRAAHVGEPGSTSFLAVGLTSVLALLFLVDSLLDRSMIVVIPVLSAGSFAAAHWVTRTFIEPGDPRP